MQKKGFLKKGIKKVGLLALLIGGLAHAQTPIIAPAPYSSTIPVNYVRAWNVIKPETNATVVPTYTTLQQVHMTTQYFDGLGRPIQTVVKQGALDRWAGSPVDYVVPVTYDQYGREQYKYLPFVANTTGGNTSTNDGGLKYNPFQEDSTFSKGQYSSQGENFFYSQTVFEASPLNRPLVQYAPGNNWVGASRGAQMQNLVNKAGDSVRVWNVDYTIPTLPTSTNTYDSGQLYKTVTIDEQSHQIVEYKDKEGKVVMKKVQLSGTPGTAHIGWLCTYYVYDDLEELRYVLQPRGVELLLGQGNWTVSTSNRDEQCFYYHYDSRGRMTIKKVPGEAEVWMVYDARDRLALTQDSVLRAAHQWMYTQYDLLNRSIASGLLTDHSPLSATRPNCRQRTAAAAAAAPRLCQP